MTIAQNFVKQKKIAGKQRWRKLLWKVTLI
jgi:hypothetical protein